MDTILQVDDDSNDVFLLQHALRKAGIANPVQIVSDGQEAIDYLKGAGKFADRETFPFPSLLLLDLKLPYVMGLDVLRWIRTQPMTPLIVVMLTASAAEADITEAYRLGANAFLTKPSEANKFEDMVKAIKAFWLTHNTPSPEPLAKSRGQEAFRVVLSHETTPIARSLFRAEAVKDRTGNGNGHPPSAESCLQRSSAKRPLTKRQTEVIQLIAQGYSSREIATRFSVSIKTIEKHRQALMDRLDIHEVATLTRYAVSCGLVECSPGPPSGSRWRDPQDAAGDRPGSGKSS